MKNFRAAALVVTSFCVSWVAHAGCLPLTFEKAQEMAREKGSFEIVFFASWCSSCQHHLQEPPSEKERIFVAAFDKAERAERVLKKFQPGETCYLDEGLTSKLGINTLPAKHILKPKEK